MVYAATKRHAAAFLSLLPAYQSVWLHSAEVTAFNHPSLAHVSGQAALEHVHVQGKDLPG